MKSLYNKKRLIKEYKENINEFDKKLDEMSKRRLTEKEQEEYNNINDLRYIYAKNLYVLQLEEKIKKLEAKIKKLEGGK